MILGLDLSPNHLGAISLDENGIIDQYYFITESAITAKNNKGLCAKKPSKKQDEQRENYEARRLTMARNYIANIYEQCMPKYVGIEGYSYDSKGNSHYQYGELSGVSKLIFWDRECNIRIYQPGSIKKFATGNGRASSSELFEMLFHIAETKKYAKQWKRIDNHLKKNQTCEDLAVAYWIAKMVWIEIKLKNREISVADLEKHQQQVFLRKTKDKRLLPLIDRPWIEGT
jgi:Holliday junction resolvasome RuvABC endonuclease subunit